METLKLIPAYGRDYRSKAEVRKDWELNRDFLISDMSSPWDGKPTNREDCEKTRTVVHIRYGKLRKVVVIKPPKIKDSLKSPEVKSESTQVVNAEALADLYSKVVAANPGARVTQKMDVGDEVAHLVFWSSSDQDAYWVRPDKPGYGYGRERHPVAVVTQHWLSFMPTGYCLVRELTGNWIVARDMDDTYKSVRAATPYGALGMFIIEQAKAAVPC